MLSRLTKDDISSLEGSTVNAVHSSPFCDLLSTQTGQLRELKWTRSETKTFSQLPSPLWRSSLKYFFNARRKVGRWQLRYYHGFLRGENHRCSTENLSILPATRFTCTQLPAAEWLHSLTCSIILTTRAAIQPCALSKPLQRKSFIWHWLPWVSVHFAFKLAQV